MPNDENTGITRSSICNATYYEEIGEFWDEHDTAEYWEQTYPVEFTINLDSNTYNKIGGQSPPYEFRSIDLRLGDNRRLLTSGYRFDLSNFIGNLD